jgi:hypothetical protein
MAAEKSNRQNREKPLTIRSTRRAKEQLALMSPQQAVRRAFWTVQLPVLFLLLGPMIAYVKLADEKHSVGSAGFTLFAISFGGGFILAWLAWSLLVPRWRLWSYERVEDIKELKRCAVSAQLIWPEGHFFERTEIASKELRQKLRMHESRKCGQKA